MNYERRNRRNRKRIIRRALKAKIDNWRGRESFIRSIKEIRRRGNTEVNLNWVIDLII